MKYFFGTIFVLGFVVLGFFAYQKYENANLTIQKLNEKISQKDIELEEVNNLKENLVKLEDLLHEKEQEEKVYTILAGGDIMMDRGVEAKIKKLGKGYDFVFDLIREDLNKVDLVFANLEGPISNLGKDTGKKYSFRFEPTVAKALAGAGIDIVSLANNHMLDWGREPLCDTTRYLEMAGIDFVGGGCNREQAERPHIVSLGNTTIAFLAYTEFYLGAYATDSRAGMSEYNLDKIINRISELKNNNEIDLVFVSMHWGEEYKDRAPERIVELGELLVDAGVDVVIGHHPHVDQEIERYGDGWIIYSLGNFVFDQSWSENTMEGLLAEIKIQKGKVLDIIPRFIELNNNFQPELSNKKR